MSVTTLARKLRLAPHLSLLQRKARRLGLRQPEDWVALAVERDCSHYTNGREIIPISPIELSNEELAALLLSVANPYESSLIRVGAQLLSAPSTDIDSLVKLCRQENALRPLAWIAKAGAETEPHNPFWEKLNRQIERYDARANAIPEAVLPHASRFRVESGFSAVCDQQENRKKVAASNPEVILRKLNFLENQIILGDRWKERRVPITLLGADKLLLFRPSSSDLLLSKMALADDPTDRADILALIERERFSCETIEGAFEMARCPDDTDLLEQFEKSKAFIRSHC